MTDARRRAEEALAKWDAHDSYFRERGRKYEGMSRACARSLADALRAVLAEEDATAPSESGADREVRDLRERIYRLRLTLPDYLPDSASEAAAVIRECADDVAVRLVRIKRMLDIV